MRHAAMVGVVVLLSASAYANTPPPKIPPAPPKDYQIELLPVGELLVGVPAELMLSITPKTGWVLKLETPFSAILSGSQEVELGQTEFAAKDFLDPKTPAKALKTSITPQTPGEHVVDSKASFFLCNEMMCQRFDEKLSAKLAVKDKK